LNQVL